MFVKLQFFVVLECIPFPGPPVEKDAELPNILLITFIAVIFSCCHGNFFIQKK